MTIQNSSSVVQCEGQNSENKEWTNALSLEEFRAEAKFKLRQMACHAYFQ